MCVALPGRIIEIKDKTAIVDFHGNQVEAMLGLVEVSVGDYCLVHAGMILQKMNQTEAESLNELMEEVKAF